MAETVTYEDVEKKAREVFRVKGEFNLINLTFTWSGPSGVLGCTGQRP
jgi:hypothetical protein